MKTTHAYIASIAAILFLTGCDSDSPTFQSAVMSGDVGSVKRYIAAGERINGPEYDTPLLYIAVMFTVSSSQDPRPEIRAMEKDYLDTAELLIEGGADPDAQHISGDTALAEAARGGQKELVRMLISKGADVNVLLNEDRETALDEALSHGESETADIIRRNGGKTKEELDAGEQK